MDGDLTWSGKHRIQYRDDVLYNCIPETCIVLLTVSPINSIKNNKVVIKTEFYPKTIEP